MHIKRFIPNAITLLNAFCGCVAAILAANNYLVAAAFFVFLGIFFDFFDGLAARKLNVQSALGVQLDSLADMVTSGLVPGIVMFKLLSLTAETSQVADVTKQWGQQEQWFNFDIPLIAYLGLLIPLASAYRLAKFNIDENQQDSFIGLPTPANALLIMSLPLIMAFQNNDIINATILNKWFLVGLTLVSSYLLNSNIHLFALKFKDFKFKGNAMRYTFLLLSIVLLILLHFAAIPIIIALYIVMSLLSKNS